MNELTTGSKAWSLGVYDTKKLISGAAVGLVGVLCAQLIAWYQGADFAATFGIYAPAIAAFAMAATNTVVELIRKGADSFDAWLNIGKGAVLAGGAALMGYLQHSMTTGELYKNPYLLLLYAVLLNVAYRFKKDSETPEPATPSEPTQ